MRVPLRVLIVEDLPEQAELVAHELTNAGFLLGWSIASDLRGCRSAVEEGVDLVVADCNTVHIDLPALMALLGELSDPPPVVGLSTDDSEEVARECLRSGASAFLHKFRLDEIGELVRGLLETRGPRRAAAVGSGLTPLHSFAENACDPIAELSSDGRLLYVNPSAETYLGTAAKQLAGRRVFEFVHPDHLPRALESLREAIETGSAGRGAHRVRRGDGSWRWLESTGTPYRTAAGERRLIVISRDVTERFERDEEPGAVTLALRTELPRETRISQPSKLSPEEGATETILLVEDDDRLRFVTRETLEEEGYAVVEAASGEEALERAANHSGPIHLMLSEMVTPGIDGRELAQRLAASRPRTRVILMSDLAGGGVEPLPKGMRPADFLRKPFTLAALRAKLREILEEDPDRLESVPMPRPPSLARHAVAIGSSVFSPLAHRLAERRGPIFPLHVGDTWMEPFDGGRMEDLTVAGHPGMHRYCETGGIPALLDAIVEKVRSRNRLPCERESVLIAAGATGALASAISPLVEPGEEVLILAPFWPLIRGIVQAQRAKPVEVPFYDRVDSPAAAVEAVEERLGERSVALYLSTPSNPTARLIPAAWLEALAELARRRDLWLISDEVYEDFVYVGEHCSIGQFAPERTLSVYSFSKAYGMAGNRVGYMVAPPAIAAEALKVATHTYYHAPTAGQIAALRALEGGGSWLCEAREAYRAVGGEVAGILGVPPPQGSCFFFLDVRAHLHGRKLLGFLEDCLEDGVVLSPGSSSGEDYPDWVRLCFTAAPPDRTIQAAHLLAKRLGRG